MRKKWIARCTLGLFLMGCFGVVVMSYGHKTISAEEAEYTETKENTEDHTNQGTAAESEDCGEKSTEDGNNVPGTEPETEGIENNQNQGEETDSEEKTEGEETEVILPGEKESETEEPDAKEPDAKEPDAKEPDVKEPVSEETDTEETETPDQLLVQMKAPEEIKAGQILEYIIELENTGDTDLTELFLQSLFSAENMKLFLNEQEGMEIDAETGALVYKLLAGGEKKTLTLSVLIPEDMDQPLHHTIRVSEGRPQKDTACLAEVKVCTTIIPLIIDYEVEKKADQNVAHPGDIITYTITIRNTGERTLHSVVTTERFLDEGVRAVFLPQSGILLNQDRTQAYIKELAPGAELTLSASVTLPSDALENNLVNQVYVTTKETGESSQLSEAAVHVTMPTPAFTQTPVPTVEPVSSENIIYTNSESSEILMTDAVQTGDLSESSRWIRISAASALLMILVIAAQKARR